MALLSESSRRGLIYLLPLAAVVILLLYLAEPRGERFVTYTPAEKQDDTGKADTLFDFDPNTATFEELVTLGLSRHAAASIVKYRAHGKIFSVREEFAACYDVSDSMYRILKPHIIIAEEFRAKPLDTTREDKGDRRIVLEPFRMDTVTVAYLRTIGFSHRRATAFLRYRDMRGGLRNIEEVRECFVIKPEECDSFARYIIFPETTEESAEELPVELNGADSATLRSIYGIGEKSVTAIIKYRRRLGGFCRVEQLAEVKSVTESNYEKILKQIYCDSSVISKIDVNFARPQNMAGHPYISDRALRKLLKTRQLKGGWSTIEEMVEDDIFTRAEAEKLRPYLRFTNDREQ